MAPHSSILAWQIPWTEEPGRVQSMGSLRVGHDWATSLFTFHFSLSCIGEGNGNPLQCSCLESPRDGGAWWAAIYGVAQSRTQLKWLSSSSNFSCWNTMLLTRVTTHYIALPWFIYRCKFVPLDTLHTFCLTFGSLPLWKPPIFISMSLDFFLFVWFF